MPVSVGVGLSWRMTGDVAWLLAFCTLTSATAIQIATNFFNDAIDFTKGTDTSERLGPPRVTQSGLFSARQVIVAGLVMAVVAVLLSLPMVAARGWPVIAIGLPSLYFAYGYTGGPLPLAYCGLGELFVVLFFGFVAVLGTVFVQTGEWHAEAVLAGLQVGMLSTVLIAVNNLR
ncbi:MAG: 1,4-dihydroxy-2-naphthoate octaprenyltransferase, partial [Verrucomicrobia bacterium]|nr:1,4-dihydroxy-2-naphthoate octaprenyltransferase [Verrucomicrobiota bacterium]